LAIDRFVVIEPEERRRPIHNRYIIGICNILLCVNHLCICKCVTMTSQSRGTTMFLGSRLNAILAAGEVIIT